MGPVICLEVKPKWGLFPGEGITPTDDGTGAAAGGGELATAAATATVAVGPAGTSAATATATVSVAAAAAADTARADGCHVSARHVARREGQDGGATGAEAAGVVLEGAASIEAAGPEGAGVLTHGSGARGRLTAQEVSRSYPRFMLHMLQKHVEVGGNGRARVSVGVVVWLGYGKTFAVGGTVRYGSEGGAAGVGDACCAVQGPRIGPGMLCTFACWNRGLQCVPRLPVVRANLCCNAHVPAVSPQLHRCTRAGIFRQIQAAYLFTLLLRYTQCVLSCVPPPARLPAVLLQPSGPSFRYPVVLCSSQPLAVHGVGREHPQAPTSEHTLKYTSSLPPHVCVTGTLCFPSHPLARLPAVLLQPPGPVLRGGPPHAHRTEEAGGGAQRES